MQRSVKPELLDALPARDKCALRSRRDLRRLNVVMRHPSIAAGALQASLNGDPFRSIAELGAGDGFFLLRVARRLSGRSPAVTATLVDRLDVFDSRILPEFSALGWDVKAEVADVLAWLNSGPSPVDALISNLLLHHFQTEELSGLLRLASRTTNLFVALEPRRAMRALVCSHCVSLIGCGPVTRHDAAASVRAGFAGSELSGLWPDREGWRLVERPAGLFSHLFVARRRTS